jgi:hypothetical protein
LELSEEEGQAVWYAYPPGNDDAGLSIFGNEDTGQITSIIGWQGSVDSTGAAAGRSLKQAYKSSHAKCEVGMDYTCKSEFSPNISYLVDPSECGVDVRIEDYFADGKETVISECMKLSGIELDRAETR